MPPELESWKPVPGYEDRYEVSDHGRVRSLARTVDMEHSCGRITPYHRPARMMKNSSWPSGHQAVTLAGPDGTSSRAAIHRLVLLAHVGPPPVGRPYALHRDDVPANNVLANLYWGSPSQNLHDSIRNGTHVQARKTTCKLGHLLVEPNLVPSTSKHGNRGCLACKLAQSNHNHDAKLRTIGRERTRYNRGKDGFQRRAGESFRDESDRRYIHIMADQSG